MQRLFLCLVFLLTCATVQAGVPWEDGDVSDGHTFRDGLWWQDGVPFTRTKETVSGGGYWNCGRYYALAPSYRFSYTRAVVVEKKVVVQAPYVPPLALPVYAPDWKVQVLKYAQARDDQQSYLDAIAALGIQGQQFRFQQSAYGNLGTQGQTLYGNSSAYSGYTYQKSVDVFGSPTDLNVLYQQAARLAQSSQQLGGDATSGFSSLVEKAGANQARVATILAEAESFRVKALALAPQQQLTLRETRTEFGRKPMLPAQPDDAGRLEQVRVQSAANRCAACHGGGQSKGGFRLEDYGSLTVEQKGIVFARLTTAQTDLRMPRLLGQDGKTPANDLGPGEAIKGDELESWRPRR